MTNRSDAVERYMDALDHPRRAEIAVIREAILAADGRITEQIKMGGSPSRSNGRRRASAGTVRTG